MTGAGFASNRPRKLSPVNLCETVNPAAEFTLSFDTYRSSVCSNCLRRLLFTILDFVCNSQTRLLKVTDFSLNVRRQNSTASHKNDALETATLTERLSHMDETLN